MRIWLGLLPCALLIAASGACAFQSDGRADPDASGGGGGLGGEGTHAATTSAESSSSVGGAGGGGGDGGLGGEGGGGGGTLVIEEPRIVNIRASSGRRRVFGLAVHGESTYAVGSFQQATTFGVAKGTMAEASRQPAVDPASDEAFVVKYDGDGLVEWVLAFGGAGHDVASGVVALDDGSVVVVGLLRGENDVVCELAGDNAFALHVSPTGTPIACVGWSEASIGDGQLFGLPRVTRLGAGAVVSGTSLAGRPQLNAVYGATLAAVEGLDTMPGRAADVASHEGRLYVLLEAQAGTVAGCAIENFGNTDLVLLELDPTGPTCERALRMGLGGTEVGDRVVAGATAVYFSGLFPSAVDGESNAITGSWPVSAASAAWVFGWGNTNRDQTNVRALAMAGGALYLGGRARGSEPIGGSGNDRGFVARVDPTSKPIIPLSRNLDFGNTSHVLELAVGGNALVVGGSFTASSARSVLLSGEALAGVALQQSTEAGFVFWIPRALLDP